MNEETLSGASVVHRANNAAASEIGWARKINRGRMTLLNCRPSSKKTRADATIMTVNRLANDSCVAR